MNETRAVSTANPDPIVRSSIYQLFSIAFKYPSPEVFAVYQNGDFLSELRDNLSRLPHLETLVSVGDELIERMCGDFEGTSLLDFQVGYTQTFDVGAPQPPCPPYEGLHRQGVERTALMIEVSEFYKHFGLGMTREEGKRELPDHLSAELEFLHFLAFKEAQAMEENTPDLLQGYVLAQKDFLERHMVSWLPKFCEKLRGSASLPFFREMAGIVVKFIQSDLEWTRYRFEELSEP